MASLTEKLQLKLSLRLQYYEDIGIHSFFRNRSTAQQSASVIEEEFSQERALEIPDLVEAAISAPPAGGETASFQGDLIPKTSLSTHATPPRQEPATATKSAAPRETLSLITSIPKIAEGTLLTVREDIGDCIRCKLHKGRTKIVFGDGHPNAKLVFIGEGPGRDEDLQGLPFVGRAGKLLTQMIEAMSLKRSDVYICNVVKCRPPENRAPEKDEVAACSPFLIRQIDLISPQVIVTLGSIATQTVLETVSGISGLRGRWQEFRGIKLMPTYHPAYLLRNPAAKSEVWKDLQLVMGELGLEVKKGKTAQV
jgi:uracil-DNA glycosylase family 4